MGTTEIILGIILLVCAVTLTVLVLFQSGKDKRLSGTIAGAGETFFGKNKTAGNEKKLMIATIVASVVFVVTVLAMYFYIAAK